MELKKKTLRNIKIKANRNKKSENQTQNKYKMEDKTKFFKAWHKIQDPGERNERQEKKLLCHWTVACLGAHPCASNEMTINFSLPL